MYCYPINYYAAVTDSGDDHFRRLFQDVCYDRMAAIEALNGPQTAVDKMVSEFTARRNLIVEGLTSIPGISCKMPNGAFYAFPNVTEKNGLYMELFLEFAEI